MKRRYKTYSPSELNNWIKELISTDNIHAFYITKAWIHLRRETLKEQHNECQECKKKGLHELASTVHHIKTVRKYPWLALTKSNLLCLCDKCHYEIHHPASNKKCKWDDERW